MKHIHSDLMLLFARDACESATPWDYWEEYSKETKQWRQLTGVPEWNVECYYRRNGDNIERSINYPIPVKIPLNDGEEFYYVNLMVDNLVERREWDSNDSHCMLLLRRGLIHRSQEDAYEHGNELIWGSL